MPSKKDPCGDCGSQKRHHLNGCPQADPGGKSSRGQKSVGKHGTKQEKYDAERARQQAVVAARWMKKSYKTEPLRGALPNGYTTKKVGGKYYVVPEEHGN